MGQQTSVPLPPIPQPPTTIEGLLADVRLANKLADKVHKEGVKLSFYVANAQSVDVGFHSRLIGSVCVTKLSIDAVTTNENNNNNFEPENKAIQPMRPISTTTTTTSTTIAATTTMTTSTANTAQMSPATTPISPEQPRPWKILTVRQFYTVLMMLQQQTSGIKSPTKDDDRDDEEEDDSESESEGEEDEKKKDEDNEGNVDVEHDDAAIARAAVAEVHGVSSNSAIPTENNDISSNDQTAVSSLPRPEESPLSPATVLAMADAEKEKRKQQQSQQQQSQSDVHHLLDVDSEDLSLAANKRTSRKFISKSERSSPSPFSRNNSLNNNNNNNNVFFDPNNENDLGGSEGNLHIHIIGGEGGGGGGGGERERRRSDLNVKAERKAERRRRRRMSDDFLAEEQLRPRKPQEEGLGECPICFEEIRNGLSLPCMHGPFCQSCIVSWNVNHKSCPVCRRSVAADSGDCWVHLDVPSHSELVETLFAYISRL